MPKITMRERSILMPLILQRKTIIEDKKSDSASLERRYKAWRDIATAFNSVEFVSKRTCAQLKKWWQNEKARINKIASTKHSNCEDVNKTPTGSGTSTESVLDNLPSPGMPFSVVNCTNSDTTDNNPEPFVFADVKESDKIDIDNELFRRSVHILPSGSGVPQNHDILLSDISDNRLAVVESDTSGSLGHASSTNQSESRNKNTAAFGTKARNKQYYFDELELMLLQKKVEAAEMEMQQKKEMHHLHLRIQKEAHEAEQKRFEECHKAMERRLKETHQASEKRKQESHELHERRLEEIHQLQLKKQ